jgi:cytoskeletal protein CcmA (bactofilin family)
MAIFGRKPREDGPGAAPSDTAAFAPAAAVPRDAVDFGVPPFRPAPPNETMPAMTLAPKPTAAPAMAARHPAAAAGGPTTAPVGVPARPQRPEAAGDRRTLVVGRGISLQGTVADAERLVVEGTVESQMIHAAELFVAQTGVFRGEVQVEDAEIAGTFDGTLTVRGSLVIRGTGKVNGVARYRKLSVAEGEQVSGRMETLTEGGAAPAGGPSAAPAPRPPAMAAQPADAEV